ncbi:MAG: hypothetical protein V3R29_08745 [Candidatus Acidoferrales bacterium]
MWRRIFSLMVVLSFLGLVSVAAAQFPRKPKLPTTEKEKEKEEESSGTKATASSTSSSTLKEVTWADNGITFQVPDNWEELMLERDMAAFMLEGTAEAVGLDVTISRFGDDFPAEASLDANRESCQRDKEAGRMASCEDYAIGDIQGVLTLEAEKEDPEDHRRLTWIGFQNKGGVNQITIGLAAYSKPFPKHEEALRQVLATFKIETE